MMLASQRRSRHAPLLMATLVLLLGACGEAHVVRREPGYDASTRALPAQRHAGVGEIEVIRGDTLYGLAFRNSMDFRELAAINGIEAPYTIYVGQVLKLRGTHVRVPTSPRPVVQAPPHPVRVVPPPSAMPPARPVRVTTQSAASTPGIGTAVPANAASQPVPTPFAPVSLEPAHADAVPPAPAVPGSAQPAATQPAPMRQPPPVSTPPAPVQPAPIQSTAVPVPTAPRVAPAPEAVRTPSAAILPAVVAPAGGVGWHWPAKGTLLDRFMAGDATRQGIDIGGAAGDPVFAASDGVVVYSGSGLVGYGELIIIKHSDEWLSAYGHNRKRLVQEGQRVKAGQPIAEMGRTGAPRDMLHFEIRRNGRPVDPQQYLPAR